MGQFHICKLKWDLLRTSVTACTINKNTFSASFGNGSWRNLICWGHLLRLALLMKIHFVPHLESFMFERKFERKFFKKVLYNPPMGCFSFTNYHFQMGVIVMGFAEDFGHCVDFQHHIRIIYIGPLHYFLQLWTTSIVCIIIRGLLDIKRDEIIRSITWLVYLTN